MTLARNTNQQLFASNLHHHQPAAISDMKLLGDGQIARGSHRGHVFLEKVQYQDQTAQDQNQGANDLKCDHDTHLPV